MKSKEGKGATFTIKLPVGQVEASEPDDKGSAAPAEESTVEVPAQNILVVDDTSENLRLLTKLLKEQGYKVRGVTNGNMALTAVRNSPPDLILLDINMRLKK